MAFLLALSGCSSFCPLPGCIADQAERDRQRWQREQAEHERRMDAIQKRTLESIERCYATCSGDLCRYCAPAPPPTSPAIMVCDPVGGGITACAPVQ